MERIFAEFSAGSGFYAIADGLTRDGIPSPSAHDRSRNKHRSGIAWNKFAVRAILLNPRYTGFQVWNNPSEYALANHLEHLLNVALREDRIIGHVDRWLAREFARTVSQRRFATWQRRLSMPTLRR